MKRLLFLVLILVSSHGLFADISWGTPQTVSNMGVNASQPVVVKDSNGNATAAWLENGTVVSCYLPLNGSWSAKTILTTVSASYLQLRVDGSGNVIALWIESDVVNIASLPFAGSWSTKTAISESGASGARLRVNSNGDAVAVWVRNKFIESAVRPAGENWSLVSMLSSNGTDDFPDVALGDDGSTVAIWHTFENGADTIHSAFANSLGSWNAEAHVLALTPALHHHYPKVAIDGNGNAVAVWFRYNQSGSIFSSVELIASSLAAASGTWSPIPTILSGDGLRDPATLQAEVRYDGNGNVIAFWSNSFDGNSFSIESAVLPLGSTWKTGGALVESNLYAYKGDLSVNTFGHVLAAYMYFDGSDVIIQASETDITNPLPNFYSVPITISTGTDNGFPRVAFSMQGTTLNALTLWQGFDGMHTTIQAATGSKTVVLPPTNLAVVQSSTNFGIFNEYANTITWTASGSPNIIEYLIYRNGFLIDGTSGSVVEFVDHNAVQNGPVTYGIFALDNTNAQSSIVNISYP